MNNKINFLPFLGLKKQKDIYVRPRRVERLEECFFYHTMDLQGLGLVKGHWDLRGRTDDYLGHVKLKGKRVLDVGTASGFLSLEMEKQGAEVVSFDAKNASSVAYLPFYKSQYMTDYKGWETATNEYLRKMHNGYWLAHRLFESKNKVYHGDVYRLPEELGIFDITVVGQIMIHLRDPIAALTSIAQRCGDTMVIAEGMVDSQETMARFYSRAPNGPQWVWWQYSEGMYRELMNMLGFDVVSVTSNKYICYHEMTRGDIEIKTLIAKRKQPIKTSH